MTNTVPLHKVPPGGRQPVRWDHVAPDGLPAGRSAWSDKEEGNGYQFQFYLLCNLKIQNEPELEGLCAQCFVFLILFLKVFKIYNQ